MYLQHCITVIFYVWLLYQTVIKLRTRMLFYIPNVQFSIWIILGGNGGSISMFLLTLIKAHSNIFHSDLETRGGLAIGIWITVISICIYRTLLTNSVLGTQLSHLKVAHLTCNRVWPLEGAPGLSDSSCPLPMLQKVQIQMVKLQDIY